MASMMSRVDLVGPPDAPPASTTPNAASPGFDMRAGRAALDRHEGGEPQQFGTIRADVEQDHADAVRIDQRGAAGERASGGALGLARFPMTSSFEPDLIGDAVRNLRAIGAPAGFVAISPGARDAAVVFYHLVAGRCRAPQRRADGARRREQYGRRYPLRPAG